MRRILAGVVAAGVLIAAPAAVARSRARPPQSQPARAVAKEKVCRPPAIIVRGEKPAPVKLVFGRQAPKLELRVLERDARVPPVETVRRAPF